MADLTIKLCNRCDTKIFDDLYILAERFPNIEVCRACAMDYHSHCKNFADDILERQKVRNKNG